MRARLALAFVSLLAACQDDTLPLGADGGALDAGRADAAVLLDAGLPDRDAGLPDRDAGPRDLGLGVECERAEDCPPDFTPFSMPACPNSGWSCLAGSCTWDCDRPGRSCTLVDDAGERCVACSDVPGLVCPRDRCATQDLTTARVEMHGMCARLFSVSVVGCQGAFAWLDEAGAPDRLCAVAVLPTGLERAVLSCGFCQEQLVWW